MKIRSDFVSNSSSSSFIISTSTDLDTITKTIVELVDDVLVRKSNTIATDYFMRYYTMLFLGYIPLYKETINKGTKFEYEENISAYEIMIKDENFDYWLNYKNWYSIEEKESVEDYNVQPKQCTIEEARKIFKTEFEKILHDRSQCDPFTENFECCKITQNTLDMTKAIIDCGINLIYNKEEFEKIQIALNEGKQVYFITVGDDGEGCDPERIFIPRETGLSVYKPEEFKKIINCDIITKDEDEEIPE